MLTSIEDIKTICDYIKRHYNANVRYQTENIGGWDFAITSDKPVWVQHYLAKVCKRRVFRMNNTVYVGV